MAPAGKEIGPHGRGLKGMSGGWHCRAALPANFKAAFNGFPAGAVPAPLRQVLQLMQQFFGFGLFVVKRKPDFRQALVRRQFPGKTAQKITLDAG